LRLFGQFEWARRYFDDRDLVVRAGDELLAMVIALTIASRRR